MDPKLRWDGDKNIGHVAISVGHNPSTLEAAGGDPFDAAGTRPLDRSFSSTADVGGGPINFVDPVHSLAGWCTDGAGADTGGVQ